MVAFMRYTKLRFVNFRFMEQRFNLGLIWPEIIESYLIINCKDFLFCFSLMKLISCTAVRLVNFPENTFCDKQKLWTQFCPHLCNLKPRDSLCRYF